MGPREGQGLPDTCAWDGRGEEQASRKPWEGIQGGALLVLGQTFLLLAGLEQRPVPMTEHNLSCLQVRR